MLNVALKTKGKFLCDCASQLAVVKAELQIPLSGGLFELKGERFPIFGFAETFQVENKPGRTLLKTGAGLL
jgi:hypothetical protein